MSNASIDLANLIYFHQLYIKYRREYKMFKENFTFLITIVLVIAMVQIGTAQNDSLDIKVEQFLNANKYNWRDMNVPGEDGQVLYDLIINNGYKNALEIGTSTGRSGIWMAWALSKTDGRLTTIEIDRERFEIAGRNFKYAGLSDYIEQKLGNAHEIVPELEGPFDFIFVDADKQGYVSYLKNLLPKLKPGGCFTAHNVANTYMSGIKEFMNYLSKIESLETTVDRTSSSGISISFKKK
jgi:caffeoyl-CoA O-methyltransferase